MTTTTTTTTPTGRSTYTPGRESFGPQNDPSAFSVEDIAAEVKYLRRLEKRYGSHGLRLSAIVRLNAELVRRGAKYV